MQYFVHLLLVILLAGHSLAMFHRQNTQSLTIHPSFKSLSSNKDFQKIAQFRGSAAETGFSLADGGIYGKNRTIVIGARSGSKTYILNLEEKTQPILVDLDNLNPLTSLTIIDKISPLPHFTYATKRSATGWIPSLFLGTFVSTQGNQGIAYTIKGDKMAPGIFDISQLTQESGHLFHGGYSFIDNDGCGISGGAGDLNGDGIIDYAIGCRGGSYAAVVYGTQNQTFPANFDLKTITKQTGVIITSGCNCGIGGGYLGNKLVFGNFNGDDIADIAVDATWAYTSNPSRVHVIYGQRGGYSDKYINVNSIPDNLGYTIINDKVNHDGSTLAAGRFSHNEGNYTDDLIIGDPLSRSQPSQGRVIVIFGQKQPFQGKTLLIADLTSQTGLIITGQDDSGEAFGISIQLIKTETTGKKNLFIGAPNYSKTGKKKAGRIYEISHFANDKLNYQIEELQGKYGRIFDGKVGDQLGGMEPGSPALIGVKNSAGLEDVFIGAPGSGRAYLIFTE